MTNKVNEFELGSGDNINQSVYIRGQGKVVDDDTFVFPSDSELTADDIIGMIDYHNEYLRPRYVESQSMYKGNYEIAHQKNKASYKPDNRIVAPYAKYITDTFTGFFIGIPVKVDHEDDNVDNSINEFRNRTNSEDKEFELSKMASIYGRSYALLYQNEEGQTSYAVQTPIDTFLIYDDSVERNVIAGVVYKKDEGHQHTNYTLFLPGRLINYVNKKVIDEYETIIPDVPIIEFDENAEHQSIFEGIKSIMNSLNKALSEKMNDVDYFADAYLSIMGTLLDEDELKQLRDDRVLNFDGNGTELPTVEFLSKPNADTTQENLIDRLTNLIYQLSMVANINDDSFGNASGVSLEFKLLPMKNLAVNKERKFTAALKRMYKIIFSVPNNVDAQYVNEWSNLTFKFTQNLPKNISDEADTAQKLSGIVSKQTQLSVLSVVDDPDTEISRMEDEQANNVANIQQATGNSYDFEKVETDDE